MTVVFITVTVALASGTLGFCKCRLRLNDGATNAPCAPSIFSAVAGPAIADRRRTAATRASLQRGLNDRAFYPVFQPIVEIPSRRVIGFEALTRFRDGVRPDTRFAIITGSAKTYTATTIACA